MKHLFMLMLVILLTRHSFTQAINKELLEKRWKASWIAVPDEEPDRYGVYIFRKQITLDIKPSEFIIHVSADNRYKLYVNGTMVSAGPARGDIEHWNFETVDISPYLKNGKNIIAAKVWNEASWRPEAQISIRTGFILQGNTERESLVNTDKSWRCIRDESYQPVRISLPSYYVTGPGEFVQMNRHVRDWQKDDFNDSSWKNAVELFKGMPSGIIGPYGTTEAWHLQPSAIPGLEIKKQRFVKARWAKGIELPSSFPTTQTSITIPAYTSATILLDQAQLTNAYLSLVLRGGRDAAISLQYAEALYSKYPHKGNRDEVEGKFMMGDVIALLPMGQMNKSLQHFIGGRLGMLNWQ